MSDAAIFLPTLQFDDFDLVQLKSAVLCRPGSLQSSDRTPQQIVENRRQLRAVWWQLHVMQQQGVGSSDLLTGPALCALDDALKGYIARVQRRGAPSEEPDEFLDNLHRLRQMLQPHLPPASGELADDQSAEI